jgi:thiol-disulfide isomerase/thioredoxin
MRMRPALVALLATGVLAVAAACAVDRPEAAQPAGQADAPADVAAPAGAAAPDDPAAGPTPHILSFTARTLDGGQFSGASLAGRPAVLWFWAPWCGTCAGQSPTVAAVAQRYQGRVGVVGVAGLGELPAMREFVTDTEVGSVTHINDQEGALWRRFGVTSQSYFVLVDARGTVVHRGWLDSEQFAARVAALLPAG